MEIRNIVSDEIDEVLMLYKLATDLQKSKKSVVHWPEFNRSMVADEVAGGYQWKLIIDGSTACIWAVTHSDPYIWEEKNKDSALYIHRIATHPDFRGQNLVEHIVKWAKDYAVENSLGYIRMDTVGNNEKLIAYYQKFSFDFLGLFELKDTASLPAHYHNASVSLFEIKL